MIAVQHVSLFWTKFQRGADAGAIRNRLPRKLPYVPPYDPGLDWVHQVHFATEDAGQYAKREEWHQRPPTTDDGVTVRIRHDNCEVSFASSHQGKLHRPHLTGLVARLPFGQTVTIQVNGVVDGDHQRHYFEDTFHVAFAETATLDLPLFRLIDEREPLY